MQAPKPGRYWLLPQLYSDDAAAPCQLFWDKSCFGSFGLSNKFHSSGEGQFMVSIGISDHAKLSESAISKAVELGWYRLQTLPQYVFGSIYTGFTWSENQDPVYRVKMTFVNNCAYSNLPHIIISFESHCIKLTKLLVYHKVGYRHRISNCIYNTDTKLFPLWDSNCNVNYFLNCL